MKSKVDPITPSLAAGLAGIDEEEVIEAGRLFGAGPRGCAVGGTGINMGPAPILAEYLLLCLNTMGGGTAEAASASRIPGRSRMAAPRTPGCAVLVRSGAEALSHV